MIARDPAADIEAMLPVLNVEPDGRVVDLTTGEALDIDDKAAIKRVCGAVLEAYARATNRAEALRLAIEAKREPLIKAAMDAVEAELANDWDYQAQRVDLANATAERDFILDGLNGALTDRTGDEAISLDTGSALVTWGKARETWTLAHPPSWYATPESRRSLAKLIARSLPHDAEFLADRIIEDWLEPTAKRGDLPPVRVTLRGAS